MIRTGEKGEGMSVCVHVYGVRGDRSGEGKRGGGVPREEGKRGGG